jgi:hypothetical protein
MQRISDRNLPKICADPIITNVCNTSVIDVLGFPTIKLSAHADRLKVEEERSVDGSVMDMTG